MIVYNPLHSSDEEEEKTLEVTSTGIPGLTVVRGFLSIAEQVDLHRALLLQGWFGDSCVYNQAMCFGSLPKWAVDLGERIQGAVVLDRK